MALVRLAYGYVRCARIEQNSRAGECCHDPGWVGRPEILADFDTKDKPPQIARAECKVGAERHLMITATDG